MIVIRKKNKQIKRKLVKYIVYENKRVDVFYGKYSPAEYQLFCQNQKDKYKKVRNVGFSFLGVGLVGLGFTNYYNSKANWQRSQLIGWIYLYDKPKDQFRAKTYKSIFVSSLFGISGAILILTGETKRNKYNKKLKNIKLGINLSQKQKEFSLNYRF